MGTNFVGYIVILTLFTSTTYGLTIGRSTTFLGTGYNFVKGNPEGNSIKDGGLDPGLRPSLQILKITPSGFDSCPLEANCVRLQSSSDVHRLDFVDDLKKYRTEYQRSLRVQGSLGIFYKFSSLSATVATTHTQREISDIIQTKQDVMVTEQFWNVHADVFYRYRTHRTLTAEFQSHLCRMPLEFRENEHAFNKFLETWGSHVVVEARLGSRRMRRKVFSKSTYLLEMQKHHGNLVDVSVSVGVPHTTLSISSDVTTGVSSDIAKTLNSSNVHYASYVIQTGNGTYPVPTSLVLIDIPSFITPEYVDLSNDSSCFNHTPSDLLTLQKSIEEAILNRTTNEVAVEEQTRVMEVTWPVGTYSLLKPQEGCPAHWEEGFRFHDLEDGTVRYPNANAWSENITEYLNVELNKDVKLGFCSKTKQMAFPDLFAWTKGSYCFFKKIVCPFGFHEAHFYMDDEDKKNRNLNEGVLPDGEYGRNTMYCLCCRNDGNPNDPIILPIDKPFVLFPVLDQCQRVRNMNSELHYLYFDVEDAVADHHSGINGTVTPKFTTTWRKDIKLFLCYYEGIYEEFTRTIS